MNWATRSHMPTFVFPFPSFSDKLKKLNSARITQTKLIKDDAQKNGLSQS